MMASVTDKATTRAISQAFDAECTARLRRVAAVLDKYPGAKALPTQDYLLIYQEYENLVGAARAANALEWERYCVTVCALLGHIREAIPGYIMVEHALLVTAAGLPLSCSGGTMDCLRQRDTEARELIAAIEQLYQSPH